ncbi:UDP-N-acetylmuramate dehydrogenase [Anaplasma capra]|uniref:UDP-N-acetylmuramate dehydrogenase n=1 Tax=Anaplasma capra TaxID=1562740 RepID=UPI0021D5ADA3|nr:UDP-N-acetylmuramate dehydrogenase [Anaplasma capra]MCU7611950.1 UDP-N-acetylmuramate dehydrogenase [Anaplasma capra]MCU7612274.1 UDP-N-acetylmuramate dehydrogenase [Anaplasma capra]
MNYDCVACNLPKVQGTYRRGASMRNSTWFNVGGVAEVLFKPASIEDLAAFVRDADLPISVVGTASNLIIRDGIVEGVVVKLGREFAGIRCEGNTIIAGCAALLGNLSMVAQDNGISGLEFFVGIPGTVGGAIEMNAGAYGSDVASVLHSVQAVNEHGEVCTLFKDDMRYSYREHKLEGKWIFVTATFTGVFGDRNSIRGVMNEFIVRRNNSQPVRGKTGGSTFKNPEGQLAWELIDKAGCRGLRIGGAQVSEKHCNFLLNQGGATAQDLEDLGNEVRHRVSNLCGIDLEWEIRFLGRGL